MCIANPATELVHSLNVVFSFFFFFQFIRLSPLLRYCYIKMSHSPTVNVPKMFMHISTNCMLLSQSFCRLGERKRQNFQREKKKQSNICQRYLKVRWQNLTIRNVVFMWEGISFVLTDFSLWYHTLLTNRDADTETKQETNEQKTYACVCVCFLFILKKP